MKDYEEFLPENYRSNEKMVNGVWANIFGSLLLMILGVVLGFVYYKIRGKFITPPPYTFSFSPARIIYGIITIIILFAFLLIHEMIHAIVWSKFTKVNVNIKLKSLCRFFVCEEAIKMNHYIIGLIMPTIILGIIPLLIGICLGNIIIYMFGILFIASGADDFLFIRLLMKENKTSWIKDMGSKVGIIVFSPKEIYNGK
jgi:hypothetical protein